LLTAPATVVPASRLPRGDSVAERAPEDPAGPPPAARIPE
jgi:hypothetical protein